MQNIVDSFTLAIIALVFILLLESIFLYTRYRKFPSNVYVIWFRNGKIRKTSKGGTGFLWPLIDEIVLLPVSEQVFFTKFENFLIECHFQISYPEIAYSKLNWDETQENYAKTILSSKMREFLKINYPSNFKKAVGTEYNNLTAKLKENMINETSDYGLTILNVMIEES